jgi:DNA polymerase III delta prime subunit
MLNYAFIGPPGTTKSLMAKLIAKDKFPQNFHVWNMSLEGTKANIEESVMNFCKEPALNGSPYKLAIFSEADGITPAGQKALRVPMEDFADTIKIIITANYGSKIIAPLHSRGCTIHFKKPTLAEIVEWINRIVTGEKLKITEGQISGIAREARGDFRAAANILQGWTAGKKVFYHEKKEIDKDISVFLKEILVPDLDKAIATVEDLLQKYNEKDIVAELTRKIVTSTLPQVVKASSMVACKDLAVALEYTDSYVAMYGFTGEMIKYISTVKK